MYKLHYKLPVPRINTKFLLISAGVAVLLALFAYGAVRNVQERHRQEVVTALQKQQAVANKKAADAAFLQTRNDLNVQTNKAVSACGLLKQYSVAKATAKLVQYPPICTVK